VALSAVANSSLGCAHDALVKHHPWTIGLGVGDALAEFHHQGEAWNGFVERAGGRDDGLAAGRRHVAGGKQQDRVEDES
jgi:hypothetical protein